MSESSISKQYTDPHLVAAYDAVNTWGDDSEFFCRLAEKLSAHTIIDLGCGTGLLTCELAKRGHTMIGIEPASAMLEVARRKSHADKVRWIEGGYEEFDGLQADMILMTSHVAQFFLDNGEWQSMLNAAHKTLNPGGHIVFDSRAPVFPPYQSMPTEESPRRVEDSTAGRFDWWYKLLGIEGNKVRYQLHYRFIDTVETVVSTDELIFRSKEELTRSLEKAGFDVETIYGDWNGNLVTPTSEEMIFVAKRI